MYRTFMFGTIKQGYILYLLLYSWLRTIDRNHQSEKKNVVHYKNKKKRITQTIPFYKIRSQFGMLNHIYRINCSNQYFSNSN
jgi:hypothetical protein